MGHKLKAVRENAEELFGEDIISLLPLTYHYMVKMKTDEVREFIYNKRFSSSRKHLTDYYMNWVNYKPISELIID